MFERSVRFYDALYSWKDYEGEAARLHELIQQLRPGARTLLDVACGTGKHLEHLRAHYEAEGLDLEADFLTLARQRLEGTPLHQGDMRTFDLGKRFDVVTCLFSSIAYMTSLDNLRRAVQTMADHVDDGGLLIVEPFFGPEQFEAGTPWALFVDEPDLKIARMDVPEVDGAVGMIPFQYLVATGGAVEHFTEIHHLGLYTHEEYVEAFSAAGLEATHDPEGPMGRGLYMARWRAR